ncbi:hypothetical protein HIM_11988 [Hirsutella minnesotensis 3608]|uniref:Uncharacterized protein n=1 Tax=Hirsutella minnesotensis 3608 TaxID=1043627 RepID=A0A0F7ZQX4_9HYPO|nr:hypothetical protein HIM_11988 [Hirsutella minnesotensis 3608]
MVSAPVPLHNALATMFELGVARHVVGSRDDVRKNSKGTALVLDHHHFHACFAPKAISNDANPVFVSLRGQVKEIVDGQPIYGKGNYLQTPEGKPIHAFDTGIGGHGVIADDIHGNKSLYGRQWIYTEHLPHAIDDAQTGAMKILVVSVLLANGYTQPIETMLDLYKRRLPSDTEFAEETAQFEPDWNEVLDIDAFLTLCETLAGDDKTAYAKYFDKGFSAKTRHVSRRELLYGSALLSIQVSQV